MRPKPPSIAKIKRAQHGRIPEHILGADWDVIMSPPKSRGEHCWCCGTLGRVERAHMSPHATGGPNEPENFVLLCPRCHEDSPDIDEAAMLDWIERNRCTYSPAERVWIPRVYPLVKSLGEDVDVERFTMILHEEIDHMRTVLPGGRLSPGTCEAIARRVVNRMKAGPGQEVLL